MNRRFFLKKILSGIIMFIVGFQAYAQGRKRADKDKTTTSNEQLPLVTPGQGMAASVNYVHKNSDIKDPKLKIERQGVKFSDQKCSNCILYASHGKLNNEEVGKCQLFLNQVVKAEGWCSSWAKKA